MSVREATEEGLWHRHFTDADAALPARGAPRSVVVVLRLRY